ncbi:Transmembrane secretion effector [Devosia lucknowensis]|uniref:Transmembrane secretion effector n=1 Tax=Devosia lucknowensis TaxID=1096929 RepID=A0A1Y6ERT2_9HYPH|nr:MFS transporter [Devosia lucknowensis]SMQ65394.1 Transmembrane secretion effector [Devosia lucknowensis]
MKQHRPLISLAAATVCSVGGTRLSVIAIPWLVLTTTGSPVLTGVVGMAELLPYVMAKALGGPLIDRVGARRIAIWSDCLSTIALLIVPMLFWLGLLSIWLLIPAVALIGVLRAPADAAKQALVPTVAALGAVPLERVTGVLGASDRLAGTIGAAGAGALIVLVGPAPALLGNALAFVLSAVLVAGGIPRVDRSTQPGERGSYRADFVAGWHGLRSDPVLVGLTVMIAVTNLFDQAYAIVLLPVWVLEAGLDASFVGIFLATFSAGAIVGAAIAAAVAERVPRLAIYVGGFFFAGPMPMAILALGAPVPAIAGVLLFSGFAAGFLNPIIGAILFERIAPALVGRVIALFGALAWVLMPFGGLYAGVLADGLGVHAALWVTGALYLIAALSPVLIPSFRAMNKPRRAAPESERLSTAQSP